MSNFGSVWYILPNFTTIINMVVKGDGAILKTKYQLLSLIAAL